ncbi:hypothetical protein SGFS_091610 [Streptomyces graminofaciens]|uniref:Uncharacterized protein n=1 Tax=Streptomyces graminofaciens TaxID=68212 RepID=A0ABN5VX76_9ACTN|nr:hypothetical protein SGFS_091610 [Streptomyces graminofaciens]
MEDRVRSDLGVLADLPLAEAVDAHDLVLVDHGDRDPRDSGALHPALHDGVERLGGLVDVVPRELGRRLGWGIGGGRRARADGGTAKEEERGQARGDPCPASAVCPCAPNTHVHH